MNHVSLSSATGLCPEGTAIETEKDCKTAYNWFKAMDTGCPTGPPKVIVAPPQPRFPWHRSYKVRKAVGKSSQGCGGKRRMQQAAGGGNGRDLNAAATTRARVLRMPRRLTRACMICKVPCPAPSPPPPAPSPSPPPPPPSLPPPPPAPLSPPPSVLDASSSGGGRRDGVHHRHLAAVLESGRSARPVLTRWRSARSWSSSTT